MPRGRTENTKKRSQEKGTAWEPQEKDGEPPSSKIFFSPVSDSISIAAGQRSGRSRRTECEAFSFRGSFSFPHIAHSAAAALASSRPTLSTNVIIANAAAREGGEHLSFQDVVLFVSSPPRKAHLEGGEREESPIPPPSFLPRLMICAPRLFLPSHHRLRSHAPARGCGFLLLLLIPPSELLRPPRTNLVGQIPTLSPLPFI